MRSATSSEHHEERAIVLRTLSIRESDLIVTLLTEHRGKVSGLARGAKRSKRRFMGGIDVFDCAAFIFSKGRGEMHQVLGLDERETWLHLRDDLLKFCLASLCVEVTNVLAPEGDQEGALLFEPLRSALSILDAAQSRELSAASAVYFLLRALNLSGFHPLAGEMDLSSEVREWFETMLRNALPSAPPSSAAAMEGLYSLITYSEEIIGSALATHAEIRRHFGHFTRGI